MAFPIDTKMDKRIKIMHCPPSYSFNTNKFCEEEHHPKDKGVEEAAAPETQGGMVQVDQGVSQQHEATKSSQEVMDSSLEIMITLIFDNLC